MEMKVLCLNVVFSDQHRFGGSYAGHVVHMVDRSGCRSLPTRTYCPHLH